MAPISTRVHDGHQVPAYHAAPPRLRQSHVELQGRLNRRNAERKADLFPAERAEKALHRLSVGLLALFAVLIVPVAVKQVIVAIHNHAAPQAQPDGQHPAALGGVVGKGDSE